MMAVKTFVLSLNLLDDPRVPTYLRDMVLLREDGRSGIAGATRIDREEIYIDLSNLYHYSFDDFLAGLMRVFDHEYAHAFAPPGPTSSGEEHMAWSFEFAAMDARSGKP